MKKILVFLACFFEYGQLTCTSNILSRKVMQWLVAFKSMHQNCRI